MSNVSKDVIENKLYDEEHTVDSDVEDKDEDESSSSVEKVDSASDEETEIDATGCVTSFVDILDKGLQLDESYIVSINLFVAVFVTVLITPVLFLDPDYGNILICLSITGLALVYNNIYYTPSINNTNLKLD
jgi:hypothetical protein